MRKPATRLRILAVALGGVLLLSEPAEVAIAHEFDAASTITLNASKKRVKKRKKVVFSGQVTSPQSDCLAGRQVTLVGLKVKSTTTGANGGFSITVRPGRTSRWVATVNGTASGVHPHRHVCGGDVSNAVRVKVKRR
jgi:FtsP/CotA-like multicopper oxidase with cupredoxin domain